MASAISFGDANSGLPVGIINGPVNTTFHQYSAPERAETLPNPTIIIPFGRDKDFVWRDAIFDKVQRLCDEPASRVALVGLGGVGKSQIAIEHAYQVRDRSPETWVFWVHASNVSRYTQSIQDVAEQAKIPGRQNARSDIFQLVCNWLRSDKSGKWVIVLDNVDDASFLLETRNNFQDGRSDSPDDTSLSPLISYLPHCQNGSILITTRSKDVARSLVEPCGIVAIEPMSRVEAVSLIEKKLGEHEDVEIAAALADALEYMPLAILQATSYIAQRAPRFSVRQYIEMLQQSDRKKVGLLDYEGGRLRRDREAKNSIILTWQISFDHIRETRPSAADLLSLMSFCDRQGIPESLLKGPDNNEVDLPVYQSYGINDVDDSQHFTDTEYDESIDAEFHDDDFSSISTRGYNIEEDILVLRDYSFISVNEDGTTFEMHNLVQLSMRQWLKTQGQEERWKESLISRLCMQLPTGEYENWEICQVYIPHAKVVAKERPKNNPSLSEWASVMYKAAWYLLMIGLGDEAKKMAEDAMRVRIKLFGRTHDESLQAISMVSLVEKLQGRWDTAEKLEVEVVETRKAKMGADHPDTLISMTNLASTYLKQGRWNAAERQEVEVLEACKAKLGTDHPSTLFSMTNLALAYQNQGRWDMAEKLNLEVLGTSKTKLGVDHPSTLISMANLASTYRKQGRWDTAEKLETEVLEKSEAKLGADNPFTLNSIANLAITYWNQGRWEKAEKLNLQLIETRKVKLGADHPDTLTSMANLASTYQNQGRWDVAEELNLEVLEGRKAKLGINHPDTLASMANLAETYRNQGRLDTAEKLNLEVMKTRKAELGADHPDTLNSMTNLAATYHDQARWDAAEKLNLEVIETRKAKHGADHPDTLTTMANLAEIYRNQGRWDVAEKLNLEVMNTRKANLGADHPGTLTTMANLAATYYGQARLDAAGELLEEVIATHKAELGPDNPDTLTSMDNLALIYYRQGRWDAAEALFMELMETHKAKLGADHPDTLTDMINIACTWHGSGKHSEAISLMKRCLQSQIRILGSQSPQISSCAEILSDWEAGLGVESLSIADEVSSCI